jgi:hypothetical protein
MSNTVPNKSLGEIAIAEAIKAVKDDDSAAFTATVALGLVMAARQVERAEGSEDITDKANKATFRAFLKRYANRGGVVWRDSDDILNQALAKRGKERESAVSDYIDKKEKGARLVEGLAKLKTWSFRLMKDVCVNHADIIRDLLAKKTAGAGGDALAEAFKAFVRETYGASFAKLCSALTEPAKAPKEKDEIEAIFVRAEKLADTDLIKLIARLQGLMHEKASTAAQVDDMLGAESAPAEEMAEAA